ncbi:hypothetical protein GCM10023191_011600 [Actinoallomurus oryzae]|uniref:PPE family protein n=2 Tax=Actinoallomurus oryzae TaxID=502180 RepID=A0ABP8PDW7_9ACTN
MVDSYVSPMRSMAPTGSPSQYTDPKSIDALLKSSDPEAVAASGRGYQKFAEAYEKIAGVLLDMRTDLHDAWAGKDAAAAQSQLREMWSTAGAVREAAKTFGVTIERHGSEHLAWYKYNKPPSKSLSEAQSWMTGANERVAQAWGSLPQDLSTTLPPGQHDLRRRPASDEPSSGTYDASGSDATPEGLTDGGDSGHHHSSTEPDVVGGDGTGLGTNLAGSTPSTMVGGDNGLDGGPLLGVPGGVRGSSPSGVGTSGLGLISPGGVLGEGAGVGGAGRVSGAVRAQAVAEAQSAEAAAEAPAMGSVVGAGAAREERERTRRSWLAEEEEVWTDGVEFAPGLIEGDPVVAQEEAEPVDAPVEIDLSADSDVISEILAGLDADTSAESADSEVKDVSTQISELRVQLARLERQRDAERGLSVVGDEDPAGDWPGGDDA